jgi:apolipoprotein N-acyltransferase
MLRAIKKQSWIEAALCLASALLFILSFSFSGLFWIFAWVAFVPFLVALNNAGAKKAFLLSYFTGVISWAGTIYWLANVTFFGQILLILYLALYFGLFGLLITRPFAKCGLLFIPSLWVLFEYLRSHLLTGFPWALLGYSQYTNLAAIQIADIAGVWGVSFLIMFVNVAVKEAFSKKLSRYLFFACVLIVLDLGYGLLKLNENEFMGEALKVSVVQGNIPQELKWNPTSREFVIDRYFKLTSEVRRDSPDLIIWPEAALPVVLEDEPLYYERLRRYVKAIGYPLMFGAVTDRNGSYYNSALLLSKEGRLLQRYDKLHLVPFGEFIPFRKTLPFLETIAPIGDMTRGREYTLFDVRHQKLKIRHQFGVLICFEDVFPELARQFVNKGADFLVNITNDAWFGKSTEAAQHLAASVFRAIENRVYLVRSANTGISGFIDPRGRTVSLVKSPRGHLIFTPGFKTESIFLSAHPSFYGYYGDFLILLCLLCLVYIVLFVLYKKAMRIILLVSLLILAFYAAASYYFTDKYYFLSPINYNGNLVVRNDSRGDGSFASSRNGNRMHQGIDLFAEIGTPVLAARSGIVTVAKKSRGMGNYVVIRHSLNLVSIYGHLSQIFVTKNQFVRQGGIIGSVGKTGNARHPGIQPHLHFEIKKNGIPQDPLEYLK